MQQAHDEPGWGPRPAYSAGLDGLRAVSVVAVFAYHEALPTWRGGFLGVDVFFVISGFLITALLLDEHHRSGRIDLIAFWGRRARRLVPAAVATIVVVVAAAAVLGRADGLRDDGLAGLFWMANWHFVSEGTSYFGGPESPLRHLWSLAVEEQFYLCWPLLVAVAVRRRALGVLVVVGWLASVTAQGLLVDDLDRAYFGTDARAHALLVGAGLALARARRPAWWRLARRLAPAGAVVLAGAFVVADDQGRWMYPAGFVVVALAAATVVASLVDHEAPLPRWAQPLTWSPVVAVGRVSYGLYLWHWPVIVLLDPVRTGLDGVPLVALHGVVASVATVISYHLLECPIRFGRVPRPALRLGTPVATAGVLLVVVTMTPTTTFDAVDRPAPVVDMAPEIDRTTSTSREDPAPEEAPVRALAATPAPPPDQVVLVGGSVAHTLAPAVGEALVERGVSFRSATWLGCGVIRGLSVGHDDQPLEWAHGCVEEALPTQDRVIGEEDPDVVMWWSTWETGDRILDGELVRFGTARGDRVWQDLLVESIDRLGRHGATVVIFGLPPSVDGLERSPRPDANERAEHLNGLLRTAVGARPDRAVYVDTTAAVCGSVAAPCPAVVDGVRLRPEDGGHFGEDGAALVGPRLVDLTFDALAAPA